MHVRAHNVNVLEKGKPALLIEGALHSVLLR